MAALRLPGAATRAVNASAIGVSGLVQSNALTANTGIVHLRIGASSPSAGGLAMLMGDLLTLKQLNLPVKVVVFNNGALAFVEELLAIL
jgi:hypothetical protein